MKIRKGFVSNSSSSSFIISIPNIKNLSYDERYVLYKNTVLCDYGYADDIDDISDELKDTFNKCEIELKNNKIVTRYTEEYTESSLFGSDLASLIDIKMLYCNN